MRFHMVRYWKEKFFRRKLILAVALLAATGLMGCSHEKDKGIPSTLAAGTLAVTDSPVHGGTDTSGGDIPPAERLIPKDQLAYLLKGPPTTFDPDYRQFELIVSVERAFQRLRINYETIFLRAQSEMVLDSPEQALPSELRDLRESRRMSFQPLENALPAVVSNAYSSDQIRLIWEIRDLVDPWLRDLFQGNSRRRDPVVRALRKGAVRPYLLEQGPCIDTHVHVANPGDNHRDASIDAQGNLCLSLDRLSQRLTLSNFETELVALTAHELVHFYADGANQMAEETAARAVQEMFRSSPRSLIRGYPPVTHYEGDLLARGFDEILAAISDEKTDLELCGLVFSADSNAKRILDLIRTPSGIGILAANRLALEIKAGAESLLGFCRANSRTDRRIPIGNRVELLRNTLPIANLIGRFSALTFDQKDRQPIVTVSPGTIPLSLGVGIDQPRVGSEELYLRPEYAAAIGVSAAATNRNVLRSEVGCSVSVHTSEGHSWNADFMPEDIDFNREILDDCSSNYFRPECVVDRNFSYRRPVGRVTDRSRKQLQFSLNARSFILYFQATFSRSVTSPFRDRMMGAEMWAELWYGSGSTVVDYEETREVSAGGQSITWRSMGGVLTHGTNPLIRTRYKIEVDNTDAWIRIHQECKIRE
jgi:hypothetical protein